MPDGLLGILKLCLLALLYLFFVRVLWAVASELRGPRPERSRVPARPGRAARTAEAARPRELVVTAGGVPASFPLGAELTVGRAAGCAVPIEDSFASQLHARIYLTDDRVMVEDLTSTNGTFVNGLRITAPTPIGRGDAVRIGNTTMEVR
jgi:pSer/pThr/pTyr-binding forkhead associated (FHA) protein